MNYPFCYPSSSDSECEVLYNNSFRTNSNRETPFYTALGHPLIYYAKIKPKTRRSRENEKNKSNCFVKAFRWYTQEHTPFKSNQSSNNVNDADMNGFATWLDEKYNEYLRANSTDHNQCILSQTSTLQVVNVTEKLDNKLQTSKKFPRIKSLWRKRAKSLVGREKTCFTARSNQSLKIVLKSKTLSRAASACCQRYDFRNRSKSDGSVVSNTSPLHVKPICKSLTSGLKEQEVYVIPFDILQDDNHKDIKGKVNECKRNDRKNIKQIFPIRESSSSVKLGQQEENVCCRCYFKISKNIEPSNKFNNKITNICHCYETTPKQKIAVISETCPNTKYRTSPAGPVFSESVQTSDHSVNLDNNIIHKCPLFVKIVCADKLKDNCNC